MPKQPKQPVYYPDVVATTFIKPLTTEAAVVQTTTTTTTTTPQVYETPNVPAGIDSWGAECLTEHNLRRASSETLDHKPIVPLVWDPKLADSAKKWALTLAARNNGLKHSDSGENLYSTTAKGSNCKVAVDAWFNEYPLYRNQKIGDGDFHGYGHLTQLLWPTTTKIGCAYADNSRWRYMVCHYDPPGNFVGQKLNVRVKNKSRY